MGEPKSQLVDTVFSAGQNEGVERSILPLPQLSYVQNARMRKGGRWGKRYGTQILASTQNSSGSLLGSGTGDVRTIGAGFCVVDDQCAVFDSVSGAWRDPAKLVPTNTTSPICQSPRVPGAVSGWLPSTAYYPVPLPTAIQQLTPCSQTYGLGYLWTAIVFLDPANTATADEIVRVVATNPTTQALVFMQDFVCGTAAQGGLVRPRLVTCGSTIVLVYVGRPNNAARFQAARRLTTLAGGFGAEVVIQAAMASIAHDASSFSATQFLSIANGALMLVNAATLAVATTSATAIVGTDVSVVGSSGQPVYATLSSLAALTASVVVSVFTAGLVLTGSATVGTVVYFAAPVAPFAAYSAVLPSGGVRCSFGFLDDDTGAVTGLADERHFFWRDVSAAGAVVSAFVGKQYRYRQISRPFTVGNEVYQWCTTKDVSGGFGYATLLRLPNLAELPTLTGTINNLSCPLEMSPQDFLIRTSSAASTGAEFMSGVPNVVQIGTSATYAFCAPTLPDVPDTALAFTNDFRVIHATHFSDVASARSVTPLIADGSSFLPGGALTRVSSRGATEEGFALTPDIFSMVKSGVGGALSPSVTYKYACVYRARGELGRFQVGSPSAIGSIVMGPADSQVTLQIFTNAASARDRTQIEIYRTLGSGSVFYLVDTIDGSMQSGPVVTYVDLRADTVIAAHKVLYTQVGQTLPNAFPPPSRFGVSGQQRIWLGGLLRGDVVHASKLIFGDQSPSWADSDAFRIVLPAPCTGLAVMDNLVAFTAEGIYVISGDGPDDSGLVGEFAPPVRLPFALGCIEPRSVVTVDEGTFFQTSRGLYMLPRGFGAPVPAGDVVMDTLAAFPIIVGAATLTKAKEQVIQWACVDTTAAANGVRVVYDMAHHAWSVDAVNDPTGGNLTSPVTTIATWIDGEIAAASPTTGSSIAFKGTNSAFADFNNNYQMILRTGDLRPFGNVAHGNIEKIGLLMEFRAVCTLNVTLTSDRGASPAKARAFTGVAPDPLVGQLAYHEVSLGNVELRDLTALRVQLDESSSLEGLAFVSLSTEYMAPEGMRLNRIGNRST